MDSESVPLVSSPIFSSGVADINLFMAVTKGNRLRMTNGCISVKRNNGLSRYSNCGNTVANSDCCR